MTVTHTLPEPAVVRYRTRIPAFVDTSFRKIDRLSSGCKLDRSSVTASNQQSDHLRRQLAGLDSALRVSSEAFTISGIAEGALGEMTAVLKDIRTAVLDAAGSAVRGRVGPGQAELDAAIGKLDDIVRTTTYSGQTLLDGSRSLDYTETAVDGHPADPPLLDRAHTRIDQVNKPDSAVVTVAFTPTAAAPASSETPSSDPDAVTVAEYDESGAAVPPSVTTGAVPAESVESVESVESAESAESAAMTGAGHLGETGKTEPSPTPSTIPAAIAPVAPVPADDSAIPSEPARRASLEADNAQPGTDLDGAAVVADQEFVVTGTGGSRLFAFPSGTTVGEMADSINAVADSTGVTATVIFASDVRVDTAVPSRPTAAAEAPFVLQTVFPLSATDADVNTGAGETAVVIPESNAAQPVVEHDADAVPDQPATAAPAVSADPAEAVVSTDESAAADPVPDHHAASTVPTVAVGPDLVQSLVPGLNCDPDGRLYLQAGAETGSFTVYADKDLTRPVGEVRDGVFIAADDASLPDLGEDALVVASDSASVNEGDVFVLAFNGLSLANDHDVTLSGDIDWFVPEQSVMNGARLQENTSRDGELHFRYTPTATNPDGTVAAFQVDAFTDPDCPDSARVATSGVVTVPAAVPASGPAPQGDSGPSELPSESSPDPVSVSGLDAEAEGETVTHTVRLTPVENPEGTDNGLYVALAVPLENLPSDPATATAAFSNLGLRLSSRDYGSAAAVAVQNRAGHLFRHPDDSHAVVPPGAAVHVSGADATVSINGQPVRTDGLTAAVATPEVTGSFAFSPGEPGSATIAVVGYTTGSVVTAAGRLAAEPPPAVRHVPAVATVLVGSPDPGATDGLWDADGELVPVQLDFTRLEPAAAPVPEVPPSPAPAATVPAAPPPAASSPDPVAPEPVSVPEPVAPEPSSSDASIPETTAQPEQLPAAPAPDSGQPDSVPATAADVASEGAVKPEAVAAAAAEAEEAVTPEQSGPDTPSAAPDPAEPLGPFRVASVTTPKSVSVEYVGEGTLKITCVTRDATGKPVSKTVVTEKVQAENLRAGYYVTHPGLRGLFIKTTGTVSLEESHDPAVSDPVDLTEQSLTALEGAASAATRPHQARRDELASFSGGVPVAGEDDAVYAIQSLKLDEIGRVSFGGKDYSLADVKLGGAANLAGNSLLTLQILAEATNDIAALRDRLGAFKANMLEHNIRSLDVSIENIAVTEHAIHDSRSAEERVSFTRGMMLDQSGTSILAQANQKSQNVISLLQ